MLVVLLGGAKLQKSFVKFKHIYIICIGKLHIFHFVLEVPTYFYFHISRYYIQGLFFNRVYHQHSPIINATYVLVFLNLLSWTLNHLPLNHDKIFKLCTNYIVH